jgi:meso-butanediol dehydrogenase/(S,S)-butanediol dehydrogenase/diacetyl reductase
VRLDGEVAIVTGSTNGIGTATARRLADDGAKIVVTGRRSEAGEAVAAQIRADGGDALFIGADVSAEDDVARLVAATVDHFGTLTVLVNNAAPTDLVGPGNVDGRLTDVDTPAFERVLAVGLYGAYWACYHAIPHMQAAGHGSIVNVSSIAGVKASPRVFAYAVAKGGLQALTRSVAVDYGDDRIRANTVVVGFVPVNPLARKWAASPAMNAVLHALQITPDFGEAEDVAKVIAFLASSESSFMSGGEVYADGGCGIKHAVPATKAAAQQRFESAAG